MSGSNLSVRIIFELKTFMHVNLLGDEFRFSFLINSDTQPNIATPFHSKNEIDVTIIIITAVYIGNIPKASTWLFN